MKRILVPTDFSEFSNFATDMAISIAKKVEAEIHFVHLMDTPIDWINLVDEDQKRMYSDITARVNSANHKLDALVNKVENAGAKAKRLIQYNSDYTFFNQYVEKNSCDLILMGSHGASGFKEWFIGSNTQKVIRVAQVPVLAVKRSVDISELKEIVFVSEFDIDKINAFKWVVDFAAKMKIKIHLLYINTPSNFTETPATNRKMKPFIEVGGKSISGSTVYCCYNFENGLSEFLNEGQFVGIDTHELRKSLTERVINHLDAPVLSVRM